MTDRDALTGQEAARRVLALAQDEEFIPAWLVARALGCSKRRLLRDWTRRLRHRIVAIGHERKLPAKLVLAAYFPHFPVIPNHIEPPRMS